LELLTFDFPRGFDISGLYEVNISKYADNDSATNEIEREVGITMKPGRWYNKLGWFSICGKINEKNDDIFLTSNPAYSKLLTENGDTTTTTLERSIGLNIFPNETFFFKNNNKWNSYDTTDKFTTTNEFELFINNNNTVSGRLNYLTDYTYYNADGSTKYKYKFARWLSLTPEVKGEYKTDSTGNETSAGPQLSVSFSFDKWSFIKSFINDHSVSFMWDRKNGKTGSHPDFTYNFTANIITLPNFKIANQETVTYSDGSFDCFAGYLTCTLVF
jgi:hypothetical protein